MAHLNCPSCMVKLRTPSKTKTFRCPGCRKTLDYSATGEIALRPDRRPTQQSQIWRRFLFEGAVAIVGLVCLAPLFALQKYVLVPVGLENPFTKQIIMPGMIDEEGSPGRPLIIETHYNGILYWGRIASFSVIALALWYSFWRIKRRLTTPRERIRKGKAEAPVAAVVEAAMCEETTESPNKKNRVRVRRSRSLFRVLSSVYRDESPGWVFWGGGTASAIVLAAGALSAYFYR